MFVLKFKCDEYHRLRQTRAKYLISTECKICAPSFAEQKIENKIRVKMRDLPIL